MLSAGSVAFNGYELQRSVEGNILVHQRRYVQELLGRKCLHKLYVRQGGPPILPSRWPEAANCRRKLQQLVLAYCVSRCFASRGTSKHTHVRPSRHTGASFFAAVPRATGSAALCRSHHCLKHLLWDFWKVSGNPGTKNRRKTCPLLDSINKSNAEVTLRLQRGSHDSSSDLVDDCSSRALAHLNVRNQCMRYPNWDLRTPIVRFGHDLASSGVFKNTASILPPSGSLTKPSRQHKQEAHWLLCEEGTLFRHS